jgi:hypothetical protein
MNTAMSRTLDKALAELSELPEDQQATLVARIEDMIARAKVDARLAASEERGGEMPSDVFFAQLRARYGG